MLASVCFNVWWLFDGWIWLVVLFCLNCVVWCLLGLLFVGFWAVDGLVFYYWLWVCYVCIFVHFACFISIAAFDLLDFVDFCILLYLGVFTNLLYVWLLIDWCILVLFYCLFDVFCVLIVDCYILGVLLLF